MIKNTSVESYIEVCKTLGTRQRIILEAVKRLKVCTRQDLVKYSGYPINSITPRVKELLDLKLIEEYGEIKNLNTNRYVKILRVV